MSGILLVDSDRRSREALAAALREEIGCVVLEADKVANALEIIDKGSVHLLITELFPPQNEGIDIVKRTHKINPEITIIPVIPAGNRDLITKMLQLGSFFYINSPYDYSEAVIVASRALKHAAVHPDKKKAGPKVRKTEGFHGIIGKAKCMLQLFDFIEKVADDADSTVLIQGESGTGKELVVNAIHARSVRKKKNIVPINCAAIPDELLESELFGYIKGAFTGATHSKIGRIQYADGGTLFLDEIGDMKPALQAKLLRVIQEKMFEPVGALKPVPVDVRIIAATHRDLEKEVAEGRFREDLYYRLKVVPIGIPPLRERKEDIPLLIDKFVQVFNRNKKAALQGFEAGALEVMINYAWPGNVRELENLVQRLAILHGGQKVSAADLPKVIQRAAYQLPFLNAGPAAVTPAGDEQSDKNENAPHNHQTLPRIFDQTIQWDDNGVDFKGLINNIEKQLITRALSISRGNKKEAAKLLNLKRTTLLEKIKNKGY